MKKTLTRGSTVALRYTIIEPLGSGGMATVYRARHTTLRREVALKVMTPNVSGPLAARFDREARNAARLDHPGCVRVFDYGTAVDGSRFIAMDLLAGPTLRAEIDGGGQFAVGKAVWIVRELLKALAHAHEQGVLHRDVKPENVMFSARNDIVLIDFGLSQLDDDAPLTALGTCIGSPSYLAPERLLGQKYDERADLYAVGVILYELLAGRRPFIGAGPVEVAARQIDQRPIPIIRLRPELPRSLAAVVDRALAKSPADRFNSAVEMLAALELSRAQVAAIPAPLMGRQPATSGARLSAAAAGAAALPPTIDPRAATEPAPYFEASRETTFVLPRLTQPSFLRRLWQRLRFGRWRWRGEPITP